MRSASSQIPEDAVRAHLRDRLVGSLLGTAVGDAVGPSYEGLSRARAARMLGAPDRHRLFFRRGLVSDDTEHACMVAQALIASSGDATAFSRELAKRLRWWLLGCPAGVGLATLRSIVRLWLGFNPQRSGVFSAGNGPAMRAPIIGAALDSLDAIREHVRVSSRMTHTDPRAENGALAVALAAHLASRSPALPPADYFDALRQTLVNGDDLLALIAQAVTAAAAKQSTLDFVTSLGLQRGVSGYVNHTVPVALHAWFTHPTDLRQAVISVIQCGGDTDSTAAIVGGIVGAAVGRRGVPQDWLNGLVEWPRSVAWMERLAGQLAETRHAQTTAEPLRLPLLPVLARNAWFAAIVLFHGFRRLAPPY